MDIIPFPYFLAFWGVLGAVGTYLFYFRGNAEFKRKYFRWYAIFGGVIFLTFPAFSGFPWFMMMFASPFVALIIYLNVRNTMFCDECGRTNMAQIPFVRPKHCSKCGAKLHN
jgi:hypothetical protein